MDDLAVREAALRLAIESVKAIPLIIMRDDAPLEDRLKFQMKAGGALLRRAEEFEAYLRGPIPPPAQNVPEGGTAVPNGWQDRMGLR